MYKRYVCAQVLGRVRLFVTPWTVAHQASLSMGFSRLEYWSGLPFPTPENLLEPGTEFASPVSLALAGRVLPIAPPGSHIHTTMYKTDN